MAADMTYIMIKPDGVQRGLVGEIIARFERKGLKLVAMKMMSPSKELLESHYKDLSSKSFFPGLIAYMSSGPVVCMVWQGKDAYKVGRALLGECCHSLALLYAVSPPACCVTFFSLSPFLLLIVRRRHQALRQRPRHHPLRLCRRRRPQPLPRL